MVNNLKEKLNNLFNESEGVGVVINNEEIMVREEIEPLISQIDGYIDGAVWVTLQDGKKIYIKAL